MFASDILDIIVTWGKISLKCACGQEELVQLGDVTRGFGRPADGQKVSCKFGILVHKI